jgi:integrase
VSEAGTVICPQCGSQRLYRDGLRRLSDGLEIQRWLCRNCDYRFSDPIDIEKARKAFERAERLEAKSLKSDGDISSARQICVLKKENPKNLAAEQKTIQVPRRTEVENLKGAIAELLWHLKKEGYSKDTCAAYGPNLDFLVKNGANLFDPENVKEVVARLEKTNIRKYNLIKAYRCFTKYYQIEAKLPKYKITRPLPYIPPEEFLDQLIACCNQQMATFMQTLKETAARPVEAWRLEWDDLDIEGKKLNISHPAKGCNPRIRPISDKLLHMLLALPRTEKKIFTYRSRGVASKTFRKMRKRAVQKLGNPALRKIDFYTCRYWRATMEYRRTHDFGVVMLLLGHKSLRYVLLYAQLSEAYSADNGYVCKEATNRHEAKQLIEAGFEYVMETDGVSLFRKLK